MFKKQITVVCLLLLPIVGFWIYQMAIVRPSDLIHYKEMVEQDVWPDYKGRFNK